MTTSPPTRSLRVHLAGAGRVGTAVAELLRRAGHQIVSVSSRSEESAAKATRFLGTPVVPLGGAVPGADTILLGVTESAIEEVCRAVVPSLEAGATVVHFAGAYGIAPLSPAFEAGHPVAALHPVQACPDIDAALRRLPGSAWGVTCIEGIETWCDELVAGLSGVPVPLPESARPLWHAASVTTSNAIAALLAVGEALLESAGIADPVAVLGPLAAGTVANAREGGGGARTLTGPAVRGEAGTIARHLDAMPPHLAPAYRLAVRLVLEAAAASDRIAPDTHARIAGLVRDPS